MHRTVWEASACSQIPLVVIKQTWWRGYVLWVRLLRWVRGVFLSPCLSISKCTGVTPTRTPAQRARSSGASELCSIALVNLSQELRKEMGAIFTCWHGKANAANVSNWWIWENEEFLVYCYTVSLNLKLYKNKKLKTWKRRNKKYL